MDIRIETKYHNCYLRLENIQASEVGDYECDLMFHSGWLSCQRFFMFSKNQANKFKRKLEKIKNPFDIIATLETKDKNSCIQFKCTGPGTIMVSGEFIEHSEFEQQATLGFNVSEDALNSFISEFGALLKAANRITGGN